MLKSQTTSTGKPIAHDAASQLAIVLDEHKREAWNTIVRPYRFVKVPDYLIFRWLPLLGASRTLLLLAFRQAAFVARSHEPFGEEVTHATISQLAMWSGLSVGAVYKLLADPGYLTWFVRGIGQELGPDGKPLTNRDRRTYHVRVDIPLTPADQWRLRNRLESAAPESDEDWLQVLHEAISAKKESFPSKSSLPYVSLSIQDLVREYRGMHVPLSPQLDQACSELHTQWVGTTFGQASHYWLRTWVPDLPPGLACLILWSRRKAYADSEEAELKHVRAKNEANLAKAIGVSKKTIQRWRKREHTPLFLTFIEQHQGSGVLETIENETIVVDRKTIHVDKYSPDLRLLQEGDFVSYHASLKDGDFLRLRSIELSNPAQSSSAAQTILDIQVRMSDPIHPTDWERYARILETTKPSDDAPNIPSVHSSDSGQTEVNIPETKVNNARTNVNVHITDTGSGTEMKMTRTKVNDDQTNLNKSETEVNDHVPKMNVKGTKANTLRDLKSPTSSKVNISEELQQDFSNHLERSASFPTLSSVVVDTYTWPIAQILKQGAVPKENRQLILDAGATAHKHFIAWLLFGLAQESIRYPVLYAARRSLEGDVPPDDFLELSLQKPDVIDAWIKPFGDWSGVVHKLKPALQSLRQKNAGSKLRALLGIQFEEGTTVWSEHEPEMEQTEEKHTAEYGSSAQKIVEPSPAEIWSVALVKLEHILPRDLFTTWVRDMEAVKFDSGEFVLRATNEYALAEIESNLHGDISKELSQAAGTPVEVKITVD